MMGPVRATALSLFNLLTAPLNLEQFLLSFCSRPLLTLASPGTEISAKEHHTRVLYLCYIACFGQCMKQKRPDAYQTAAPGPEFA